MPYRSTIERVAMAEGLQGGLASAVMLQLTHRYGELSNRLQSKLKMLSPEQLYQLLIALLDFKTKTE